MIETLSQVVIDLVNPYGGRNIPLCYLLCVS